MDRRLGGEAHALQVPVSPPLKRMLALDALIKRDRGDHVRSEVTQRERVPKGDTSGRVWKQAYHRDQLHGEHSSEKYYSTYVATLAVEHQYAGI